MTPRSIRGAVRVARGFNREGIACSLAYLPVPRSSEKQVAGEVRHLEDILSAIARQGVQSDITLKMQCLGIRHDERLARNAALHLVAKAAASGTFVWIDMELPDTVDATIRIFREASRRYHNTGLCLQAYLTRTEKDLEYVLRDRVPVRLVKGFYAEHDIQPWSAVTDNYRRLMEYMLVHSDYPAIATHDLDLIAHAQQIIRQHGISNAEFQFFRGVRDDYARALVREGFRVRIYVPFGRIWKFLVTSMSTFDKWHHLQRMMGFRPAP